jgi:plasmid stability protein
MKAITLRNIPPEIQKAIRAKAKEKGISMNRAVLELLEERLGTQGKRRKKVYTDLDFLFGSWTQAEADEFNKALEEQRRVYPEDWR